MSPRAKGTNGLETTAEKSESANPLNILKQDGELWDLFTRKEEYIPKLLDRHSRFPHSISTNKDCLEARASVYLTDHGFRVNYPDEKHFAVCLTHDIDCLYVSKDCILDVLKNLGSQRGPRKKLAMKIPLYLINQRSNPIWNFEGIMEIEREYGAKSNFFFLATDRDFGRGTNYRIEDLKDDVRHILAEGWNVGLHCGYHSYDNLEELKKEKLRLENVMGRTLLGCRNHYLRFKVPDTWELQSQVGFKYDATLGYADFAGFRNGMCHPFKPFNLNTQKEIDILEIPLVIMDCTLFDYMGLDIATAWGITKQLIDTTAKQGGVMTVLWHNTYMLGENIKYYRKILEYCMEKDAWMTSCDDLSDWWGRVFAEQ